MFLKDIWKDKTDGVDDVLADDINEIAKTAIKNEEARHAHSNKSVLDGITEKDIFNWNNGTEIQMRKYYDEPFDKISDVSLFEFILDENMTAAAYINYDEVKKQEITELVIPYEYKDGDNKTYSITSVRGKYNFEAITLLTKVILPKTITSIGEFAFKYCTELTSITIPDKVRNMDTSAFEHCTNLIDVNIPHGVTKIDVYSFHGCTNLVDVIIPEGVRYICAGAFEDCTNLTNVNIPDSVTSIDSAAFCNCTALMTISIPNSVTLIGNEAFYGCDNLTIRCYKNSAAEEYCIANDIPYELLDIDIVTETTATIFLKPQQELRLGTLTGPYSLLLPTAIPEVYESYWTFTAGEGLSLSYSDLPVLWRGDDCGSDGYFEPVAGTMYEVILKKINDKTLEDGTIEPVIVARVGAI